MRFSERTQNRATRRDRAVARVKEPVPTSLRAFDPLLRPTGSKAAQTVRMVLIVFAAFMAHALMFTAIYAANRVAASIEPTVVKNEKINVAIIEPPPPPPVEVAPPPKPPEPETAPPPPKKKPPPKKEAPPPPDPTDLPPEPPKEPPKKQPRRIVGLSLESTVNGKGPGFAVGNTRMGRTEDKAEDAKTVKKLDKIAPQPPPNREATRIPGIGRGKIAAPAPRGGRIRPQYPKLLRAQNVEGNVTVEVRINKKGAVTSVRIIEGSRFEEFEQSALAAAKQQRWTPATQGGKPIAYTLTYTYRFRITD